MFACFIVHIYCGWWFTCTSATLAPWVDLKLYKNLLDYRVINVDVAKSAILALKRHLWYLTPEIVFLSMFSAEVPTDERSHIATELLKCKPDQAVEVVTAREGPSLYGKPLLPGKLL